jgi:hypothetical protein
VKVLLLGEVSGTRDGQAWPPRGSVVELPEDEAIRLCENRMARPVVTEMVTMGAPAAETAVVAEDVERRGPLTTKTGPGRRARSEQPA